MKRKIIINRKKILCAFSACLLVAGVAQATSINWISGGGADTEWSNTNNWEATYVPGNNGVVDRADFFSVDDNATVTSNVSSAALVDVHMRNRGQITISADMTSLRDIDIGINGSTAGFGTFIKQSAGTVDARNLTLGTDDANGGLYEVSGTGVLDLSGNVVVGSNGNVSVIGSTASVGSSNLTIQTTGILAFTLDAGGVGAINVDGAFTVDGTSSVLTIDGSSYAGGAVTNELVRFGSISGAFDLANSVIDGLSGASIVYDSDSMNLVIPSNTTTTMTFSSSANWSSADVSSDHAVIVERGVTVTMDTNAVANSLQLNGTLKFDLELLGNSSLTLGNALTLGVEAVIEVDGSDYEGLDDYFPLILCSNLDRSLTNSVIFTGSGVRQPAVVLQDDGLWLRVIAPPSLSARICALIPDSTVATAYTGSVFSATRSMDLSGSPWQEDLNEARVMDTFLSHQESGSDSSNRSWDLRIGRGGQLYSFRTPEFGETVPPQSYGANSPWIDSVWQGVVVDSALNQSDGGASYFIHQAGVYGNDASITESFYSPMLSSHLDEAERSFTAINWGQHASTGIYTDSTTDNDWQSHVLYFNRYHDLGDGLIEVSLGCYNYGPDTPSHLNLPFGGVRRTALEHSFLSEPDGSWSALSNHVNNFIDNIETGGWLAYCDSTNGASAALGLVFGYGDTPFAPPAIRDAYIRAAYYSNGLIPKPDETAWRNGHLFTNIRKFKLVQGTGVWCRYYFVLGDDVADVAARIAARGLVANATLDAFDYTEASTPLVAYRTTGSGATFQIQEDSHSPDFFLYAHPVTDSFPIYEIIESDNTRHLTWNPYATGVIKTYDGTISGMRLLGFALPTAEIAGSSYAYESLDAVLGSTSDNYLPSGETLSVRTATTHETWRIDHFGFADNAGDSADTANPDSDELNNLGEYAFGGDPTNENDIGYVPRVGNAPNGFEYIYARRTTSGHGLTYTLESSSNLLTNDWKTAASIELPNSEMLDADFESVTNRVDTAGKSNEFFRIKVDSQN